MFQRKNDRFPWMCGQAIGECLQDNWIGVGRLTARQFSSWLQDQVEGQANADATLHPLDFMLAIRVEGEYFSLMASWFYETSWDCVGQRSRWGVGMLGEARSAYLQLHDRTTRPGDDRFGMLYGVETAVAVSLLHQFGWVRLPTDDRSSPT
jgi:hypothetical protein